MMDKNIDKIIIKEYINNKKSLKEIANILGVCKSTVYRRLKKNKIVRRNKKESIDNYYLNHYSWSKGLTKYEHKGLASTSRFQSELRKGKTWEELYGKEKAKLAKQRASKSKIGIKRKPFTLEHRKRISKARIGMKFPKHSEFMKKNNPTTRKEIRELFSKMRIGKGNHQWQGGISFEPYDKKFNNQFKRAIRKRDNKICMLCGIHREKLTRALNIHHINYNKLLTIPQNCISLCLSCHIKTNGNREHWIKFFQSLLSERYGYEYSELNEPLIEIKNGI